jgi:hypothetical protein
VKYFQCSLLASHVLLSAPRESDDNDEEILAAFFYYVPAPEGGQNLGVMLVSASLTLYLVMHGMPQAFSTLTQVCLPYGGFAEVSAGGVGGSVLWSDMSLQRILRYDCMKTGGDELHKLRYARFVHYLAKPSFKELPAAEQEEGRGGGGRKTEDRGQRGGALGSGGGEVQSAGDLVPRGSIARSAGFKGDSGTTQSAVGNGEGSRKGAKAQSEEVEKAQANSRCKVMREGESLSFDGKPYTFVGRARWRNVMRMLAANGEYVKCDKKLKGFFSKDKEANAFYEAAIEAEGQGRNGTGRYRMKT